MTEQYIAVNDALVAELFLQDFIALLFLLHISACCSTYMMLPKIYMCGHIL